MAPTKCCAGAISCLPMGGRGRGSEGSSLVGQCCLDYVISSHAKEVVCMRRSPFGMLRANRGVIESRRSSGSNVPLVVL